MYQRLKEQYGARTADEISQRGAEGEGMIEKYGTKLSQTIEKTSDADRVIILLEKYGENAEDVLEAVAEYGDDAIEQFRAGKTAEEVAEAFKGGSETRIFRELRVVVRQEYLEKQHNKMWI